LPRASKRTKAASKSASRKLGQLLAIRLDDEVLESGRLLGDGHFASGFALGASGSVEEQVTRLSLRDESRAECFHELGR
jgi:hypothetical protein